MFVPCLNAFALSGRVNIICCGITQGVASLALGILCYPPNFTRTFCVNICNYLIAQVGGTDTYFSS